MLFMGEEYAESAPFQYFVSHGDPALIEAVRKGRRKEFAEFGWAGDIPDPQSAATFLRCKLQWDLQTDGRHRVLWNFYRELLRVRRDVPPLAKLDKERMEITPFADQKVLLVRRWDAGLQIVIVHSFDRAPINVNVRIPAGSWRSVLDSNEERWGGGGGSGAATLKSNGEVALSLNPWAFLVLAQDTKLSE
jgi:maltooligosyltrehalose trehalohydrolase